MSNLTAPTVRLACANGQGERNGSLLHGAEGPALLVSYVYLAEFRAAQARYRYRDWVLDSGAFSAFAAGTTIPLPAYIDTCRELLATDPTLTEVFALDVIGDHRATLRNTEAMWSAGIPAIPAFHYGTPESVLLHLAATYPKIALGGCVGISAARKNAWAAQCFARVWPKAIHGFGFGGEVSLFALPWHSVDATNWEAGPCRFGSWKRYGKMSVRGSHQNLRAEVEYYLELERRARVKWRAQMAVLAAHVPGPSVRLAADFGAAKGQRIAATLDASGAPS